VIRDHENHPNDTENQPNDNENHPNNHENHPNNHENEPNDHENDPNTTTRPQLRANNITTTSSIAHDPENERNDHENNPNTTTTSSIAHDHENERNEPENDPNTTTRPERRPSAIVTTPFPATEPITPIAPTAVEPQGNHSLLYEFLFVANKMNILFRCLHAESD
jgi:hypothetical protein